MNCAHPLNAHYPGDSDSHRERNRGVHARRSACGKFEGHASGGEIFADATESSGIRFRHVNGMSGEFYYPEITGRGRRRCSISTTTGNSTSWSCRGRRSRTAGHK